MMADVKWIKITTDIFDDEKILMIESMPSADSIIVIWFKLLAFAGKQNNDGVFLMSNRIAYTDEMLASIFRREVNTIRLALKVFEQFGMIEIVDKVITIPNWGKHQTLDAYEKKKQRDRERIARKRAEQKALIAMSPDKSPNSSPDKSPDVAFSEEDKEGDKERDLEDKNNSGDSTESPDVEKPSRNRFVPPTVEEVREYCNERKNTVDAEAFVDFYASKGWMVGKNKMKDWKAAVRTWEKSRNSNQQSSGKYVRTEVVPEWVKKPNKFHNYQQRDTDYDKQLAENDPLMADAIKNAEYWQGRTEAFKQKIAEKRKEK